MSLTQFPMSPPQKTMSSRSPFIYSDDNKRYHTYNYYLRHRFGKKVQRVSLDIGAGCPNRCGERGMGGCIFCPSGAEPLGRFKGLSEEELCRRFDESKSLVEGKSPDKCYIAYFQSGSNTFGDIAAFRQAFETALSFEGVVGLSVATRPDCLDDKALELLKEMSDKTALTVELGLQTIHDKTAELCNRGHSFAEFEHGFDKLKREGIRTGVHIINGLPFETEEMMLKTAKVLGGMRPDMLKIHMLFVEEGTALAEMYRRGEFELMSFERYISVVCSQLELMPPETVIGRLTGDADQSRLIAPEWSRKKINVLNSVDKEFVRRNSQQGALFGK